MAGWTRKLSNLDLFKKFRPGEERFSQDDNSIMGLRRRHSQSSNEDSGDESDTHPIGADLFQIAGLVSCDKHEDAVYDQSDNLARDCREFYERRLDAVEDVAQKWGLLGPIPSQSNQFCDSSAFHLGGESFRSACSSGYFSLVSHPSAGPLQEKLSSLVEVENENEIMPVQTLQCSTSSTPTPSEKSRNHSGIASSRIEDSVSIDFKSDHNDEGLGSMRGEEDLHSPILGEERSSKSNSRPNFLSDPSYLQTKLDVLRSELLSLIHLDNELFKQLLTLNDTIEEMKEGDGSSYSELATPSQVMSDPISTRESKSPSPDAHPCPSHDNEDEEEDGHEQEINDLLDEALDLTSLSSAASTPRPVRSLSGQQQQAQGCPRKTLPPPPPLFPGHEDEIGDDFSSSSPSWPSMSPASTLDRDQMSIGDHAPNSLPQIQPDPIRSVIRSQSILLRSGFQRQRVSFPATGKNKRGRGSWAHPPVKRELPVHALLIPSPLRDLEQSPTSLPGFHTLSTSVIRESREKNHLSRQILDPESTLFDNDTIASRASQDNPRGVNGTSETSSVAGDEDNNCLRDTSEPISLPPAWKHVKQSSFDSGFIRGRSSGSNSSRHSASSANSSDLM